MDLIAQGGQPHERWRRRVPKGQTICLGRTAHGWAAQWDAHISRRHVELTLGDDGLSLQLLPAARNPVFVDGHEVAQALISPGDHFVIGQTTFTLTDSQVMVTLDDPLPATEQRYSAAYLRGVRYRDADQRIDVLSRLPDLIQGATDDAELFSRLVNVLLAGVPRSTKAAIVDVGQRNAARTVAVLHWDTRSRTDHEFRPSERLIRQAVEKKESIIHVWTEQSDTQAAFTQRDDTDWAFCTPIAGGACDGWALYLSGVFQTPGATPTSEQSEFRDDLKFAESAAAMLGNLRAVQQLERGNAALSQFFSPRVLEILTFSDAEVVLAPREANISVLFGDLRGFSLHAERSADDLLGLLAQVSQAMSAMTRSILDHDGVVGDFHGDAVMGFWGWPLPQPDGALQACLAALKISSSFCRAQESPADPLGKYGFGIGIATGTAVAGKIGSVDQFKVTVFGPVVNLASRLEGMTKKWNASILLDEATDSAVRGKLPVPEGRLRRLTTIQPYGMRRSVSISELLPGQAASPQITDEQITVIERSFEAFRAGDWSSAERLLAAVPPTDKVAEIVTNFMRDHNGCVPNNWDGIIRLDAK